MAPSRRWLLPLAGALAFAVTATAADGGPRVASPLDAHDDPLPARALHRLGTLRFRDSSFIRAAALAADGKTLAVSSRNETVRLLDAATGKEQRSFPVE